MCFRLRFQSLPLRMTFLCDAFVFSFRRHQGTALRTGFPLRGSSRLCRVMRCCSLPLNRFSKVALLSAAPRQRATAIHRKSDVLKSHRYSQDCHSEIADKIRSRRFYLKNLLPRTACKFRLWQRRISFVTYLFQSPNLRKAPKRRFFA